MEMLDAKGGQTGGTQGGEGAARVRLRGWKEIGRFFGVDERTAKRWESSRGLPVHRLPGEPRAPVYAHADELAEWLARDRAAAPAIAPDEAEPVADPPQASPRRPWLALALLPVLLAVALWLGLRAAEGERLAEARTAELTRLAAGQVAALNDQLDVPPGPVAVRAALAGEAVAVLSRVAALERPDAALRREAAEAWRRLAILQNAVDRPSLRDRAAARQSLAHALALLADDSSPEGADVRARVQLEAARQAAGGGALQEADALLAAAEPVAMARPQGALAQDWWLARAEVASWAGDHAAAVAAARRVARDDVDTPLDKLRQLRARDLEGEGLYYLGDLEAARAVYAEALGEADRALARWPADSRLRWNLLRQQWNLGSTLVTAGEAARAVPLLGEALAGWQALARADPSDEAVGAWVRALRFSYGQALEASGARSAAIPVLSDAVAERRAWLAERPEDPDRRRMLMRGAAALGDALAAGSRTAEACALYAEAKRAGDAMAADGQLTGFDRGETLRLVSQAQARHCQAAGA
ncbi:MAG: hypothetical protein SNJ79_06990 [Sphingomonadaceae bacterium]